MSGEKLFAEERELLATVREMTPGQQAAALETYVENSKERLQGASAAELAEELRNPSTCIAQIVAATLNEALARIVITCAL